MILEQGRKPTSPMLAIVEILGGLGLLIAGGALIIVPLMSN